jgi:hypothetical protein
MQRTDLRFSCAVWLWIIVGCGCFRYLYQLVRCLLGLIVVLVRRDLSKYADLLVVRHENAVLRARSPGALHACRPGAPGSLITAAATPPLGGGLAGDSRRDPGLAPQVRLAERG